MRSGSSVHLRSCSYPDVVSVHSVGVVIVSVIAVLAAWHKMWTINVRRWKPSHSTASALEIHQVWPFVDNYETIRRKVKEIASSSGSRIRSSSTHKAQRLLGLRGLCCRLSHVCHTRRRRHVHTLLCKQIHEQRTRQAVPLRMESCLVLLVLLHAFEVGVEEVGRVERAAFGFRVELRAKYRARLVDQTWFRQWCA